MQEILRRQCKQVKKMREGFRHSLPGEWRMYGVSRHKAENPRAGIHILKSRGCVVSAGAKWRNQGQALTNWRVITVCQQAQNRGTMGRHSHPGEQRTWCVSRHKMKGPKAGTHILKSRGCGVSAGAKWKDQEQALTYWRAEDVACQQAQNGGTKGRHSQTGEQRMWCVSRHKTEGPRAGTHKLESRGCDVSAGAKQRDRGQALTNWRAEDMVCQQTSNGETKGGYSHPREQRTWYVSRHKTEGQRAGTHAL
jgi:hypothetical protein